MKAVLFLAALIAVTLALYVPESEPHLAWARSAPGVHFLLGADALGRSVLVQLYLGLRTSLILAIAAVAVNLVNGLWIGYLAAAPRTAVLFSRLIDLGLAVPSLLFALLLVAMLGAGFVNLFIAFIVLGWTGFARVVRAEARRLFEAEFVLAARSTGCSPWRIAVHHMLPQIVPLLMVQATFAAGAVIIGESTLSFLGLGDPTMPSLGKQIADGVDYLREAPHLTIVPGVVLATMILMANLVGDRLQDRLGRN